MSASALAELIDRASLAVGGGAKLAEILGVPAHELMFWSSGWRRPPRPLVAALGELARLQAHRRAHPEELRP